MRGKNKRQYRRSSSEAFVGATALEKVIELAYDIGAETDFQHGWQTRAAKTLGVRAPTLSRLLRGDRQAVGLRFLQQISRKIGISIGELCGEE